MKHGQFMQFQLNNVLIAVKKHDDTIVLFSYNRFETVGVSKYAENCIFML